MKGAVEFIKKYGIDDAKQLISMGSGTCEIDDRFSFHTNDLKRLIESHELVERYKKGRGIRFRIRWGQFRHGDTKEYNDRLKQAIADVESCK